VEPLAPHEKLWVDTDFMDEDENHGSIPCHECHGGNPSDGNWKTAHKGVVKDPTWPDAGKACGECHEEIVEVYKTSLHATTKPIALSIAKRANPDKAIHAKLDEARKLHCSSCHSSCGQCHISRPDSVEGGFLDGHIFQKTPPMRTTCTACHGARVEKEYFGLNEGVPPDIHWKKKYMNCKKCHSGTEMHGDGKKYANRFEVESRAKCVDCHKGIYSEKAANAEVHENHKNTVSCQACHAMPYKNCFACHTAKDKNGQPYFQTEPSRIEFKIGLNPLKSKDRPEKFVTLRHVPVDQGTFDFYVKNGLSNFDKVPNWKLATPHTIQLKTPQNQDCNACHGNDKLFLKKKDVKKKYLRANQGVIVPAEMIPEEQ